jgi:hypothetical protein
MNIITNVLILLVGVFMASLNKTAMAADFCECSDLTIKPKSGIDFRDLSENSRLCFSGRTSGNCVSGMSGQAFCFVSANRLVGVCLTVYHRLLSQPLQ